MREIAADSARVVLLAHAKQRMRQRQVTLAQVLDVLRKGRMAESASVDIHGNWKLTIRGSSCGQDISVAGAIDMNDEPGKRVFVITVFGSD